MQTEVKIHARFVIRCSAPDCTSGNVLGSPLCLHLAVESLLAPEQPFPVLVLRKSTLTLQGRASMSNILGLFASLDGLGFGFFWAAAVCCGTWFK